MFKCMNEKLAKLLKRPLRQEYPEGGHMKTIDISGFGGGYEATCQKMLLNGLRFLKDKPDFDWSGYRTFENVYGICSAVNDNAQALDKAIMNGIDDATGAMHQAVIFHLSYIHQHSYEEWLAEAQREGREIIEIDEAEIDNTILIAQIEWKLKLDRGYDPKAELFKAVPRDRIIEVNPNDKESMERAARQIAKIINEETPR